MREAGPEAAVGRVATVEIVDDHLLFATALADLVAGLPDFRVVGVAATGAAAIQIAAEHAPDLILLDFHLPGELATDFLPDLRIASPRSRVIILTSDTSLATREAANAAGIEGFLTKEQALDDVAATLSSALGEIAALEAPMRAAEPPPEPVTAVAAPAEPVAAVAAPAEPVAAAEEPPKRQRRQGSFVAVYAAKGGVGSTTIATNLGVELARGGARTVLADLDLGSGDVGVFLDLDGGLGIVDLAHLEVDATVVAETALRHSSGLRVLTTRTIAPGARPEPAAILAAIDELRAHFDYVLCDVPTLLGALSLAVLRAADQIVLVTTPELPAMRDLERLLARASLRIRPRAILVVNRQPAGGGIPLRDIERALALEHAIAIPSDAVAMTEAINRGIPAVLGKTALARPLRELAGRVGAARFESM